MSPSLVKKICIPGVDQVWPCWVLMDPSLPDAGLGFDLIHSGLDWWDQIMFEY